MSAFIKNKIKRQKDYTNRLIKEGVICDWREPDVIRVVWFRCIILILMFMILKFLVEEKIFFFENNLKHLYNYFILLMIDFIFNSECK